MGNTILIAEDDKINLGMLIKGFTLAGFTVYSAETCKDAIRLASQHLPDCFLFDYHFEAGTIAPACLFIRRHAQLKNAPIVMLSGDSEQAADSYDSCQVDVFLGKCTPYSEILAVVKRQLRRADSVGGIVRRSDLALDFKNMCILRSQKPAVCLSPEQFRFFSMLFERSPQFVCEEEISLQVFKSDFVPSMRKALDMLAYRVRAKLGPQLARRIKNSKASGWVYLQPRDRKKCVPAAEMTSSRS